MSEIGIKKDVAMFLAHHGHVLLQQHAHAPIPVELTDGSEAIRQAQREAIIRSPHDTLTGNDVTFKADAAVLAAAYRARIALAAASPFPPPTASSNQPRGTPTARMLTYVNSPFPTPTVHDNDQNAVKILENKWRALYGGLQSNTQAAADVLMKQAQATSQLEELAQALFMQLKASEEDRARLQQLLLQDRLQLMTQLEEAQQLQQRLHKSEHRSTAVQVATESLQEQVFQTRDALEASDQERQQLSEQVKQLKEQLAVTTECRTRGDSLLSEQATVIETLQQQLEEQASTMSSLEEDKAQLESQLQGVLQAEQELTVHLRETHAAIEGQLAALRDQLKAERQKRAAVVKRRGELQSQVEHLQAQVATQQADMAVLMERLARGGTLHPTSSRATPAAAGVHLAVPPPLKPVVQTGTHPRPSSAAVTTHATHSRGAAAGSLQSAAAAAAHHQRPRATLRSSVSVPNPKLSSSSPTALAGHHGGQRQAPSPIGVVAEETSGTRSAAPSVTCHVPSALPSPEVSFMMTPVVAKSAIGSQESSSQESPSEPKRTQTAAFLDSIPVTSIGTQKRSVTRVTAVIEPPSPPIVVMSARESTGERTEQGTSVGVNRRRSVSPEPLRTSANAAQHGRRAVSAAVRPASGRATSPSRTVANNTWLP